MDGKEEGVFMRLLKTLYFQKADTNEFPYNLSFFNQEIDIDAPITILIGENGCGKTTLLELIQHELNLFQIGKSLNEPVYVKSKFTFHLGKPQGFYFSSEDFTTYIYELEKEKAYARSQIKAVNKAYKHKSDYAKTMAQGPYQKTLAEIDHLHDKNLLKSSHGESYLSFFKSRLRPNYLILLDEPETPLSFNNQLALLYLMKQAVDDGCQLVIATHSPLLMAYPGAHILEMNQSGVHAVAYEDIENVQMIKDFLNHPDRYFKHLFAS